MDTLGLASGDPSAALGSGLAGAERGLTDVGSTVVGTAIATDLADDDVAGRGRSRGESRTPGLGGSDTGGDPLDQGTVVTNHLLLQSLEITGWMRCGSGRRGCDKPPC